MDLMDDMDTIDGVDTMDRVELVRLMEPPGRSVSRELATLSIEKYGIPRLLFVYRKLAWEYAWDAVFGSDGDVTNAAYFLDQANGFVVRD